MLNSSEFNGMFNSLKDKLKTRECLEKEFTTLKSFFASKFNECEAIFNQIDSEGLVELVEKAEYTVFEEGKTVFSKGDPCEKYYFLVFGDVSLYSDSKALPSSKFLKTISGGIVFGHKVIDKFQYFAYTVNHVHIFSIKKDAFDKLVDDLMDRTIKRKILFLKKFLPNIRTQNEETISKLKDRFVKLEYSKGSKLIVDGEYDEFIYLIISGECVGLKSIKKVRGLKEMLNANELESKTHFVLEKYSKSYSIVICVREGRYSRNV